MPKKKKSLSKLREKLWTFTSKYVRLSAADADGYCSCVTCGLVRHWKEMQAGHFIAKAQGNATAWDLRNIHVQCYRCNINLGGNGAEYYPFMIATYGQDVVDELRALSHTSVKLYASDYDDMIDDISNRLSKLASKAVQFDIPKQDIARV